MLVYCQIESVSIVKDKTHTHRLDFGPHVHTSTAHCCASCKVRAKMNIAGVKITVYAYAQENDFLCGYVHVLVAGIKN